MKLDKQEMERLNDLIRDIPLDDWQLLSHSTGEMNYSRGRLDEMKYEATSNGICITLVCESYFAGDRCDHVKKLLLDNDEVRGSYGFPNDWVLSLVPLAKSLNHKILAPIWLKQKNERDEEERKETEQKRNIMNKLGIND